MPRVKKPKPLKLRLRKLRDGWWIINVPAADCPEQGPWKDKSEAIDILDGLLRFYSAHPECIEDVRNNRSPATVAIDRAQTGSKVRIQRLF